MNCVERMSVELTHLGGSANMKASTLEPKTYESNIFSIKGNPEKFMDQIALRVVKDCRIYLN